MQDDPPPQRAPRLRELHHPAHMRGRRGRRGGGHEQEVRGRPLRRPPRQEQLRGPAGSQGPGASRACAYGGDAAQHHSVSRPAPGGEDRPWGHHLRAWHLSDLAQQGKESGRHVSRGQEPLPSLRWCDRGDGGGWQDDRRRLHARGGDEVPQHGVAGRLRRPPVQERGSRHLRPRQHQEGARVPADGGRAQAAPGRGAPEGGHQHSHAWGSLHRQVPAPEVYREGGAHLSLHVWQGLLGRGSDRERDQGARHRGVLPRGRGHGARRWGRRVHRRV
mmetsp:Transcript_6286/g.16067  ORF Transcript_6286/g.16067 Transcript_6286/m.16067 type:complete len:275 (+) Transcript_6286:882-1706(+)